MPIHRHRQVAGIQSRNALQPIVSAQLATVSSANSAQPRTGNQPNGQQTANNQQPANVPPQGPNMNRVSVEDTEAVSAFLDQVMSDW